MANPASPAVLSTVFISHPRGSTTSGLRGVSFHDGRAYVASDTGLWVVDVTSPASPVVTAHFDIRGQAVAVCGNFAYMVAPLEVIDLQSSTSAPTWGIAPVPTEGFGVDVDGDRAYVAALGGGIQVVDIASPEAPTPLGSTAPPGVYAWDMAVFGDHAYVADHLSGLRVFDVSDGSSPEQVGSVNLPLGASGVAVGWSHAYVIDGGTLWVFYIGNPEAPVIAGSWPVEGGDLQGIDVRGQWAYMASGSRGLDILSIENPSAPLYHKTVDTPGFAHAVTLAGRHAYVAAGEAGLQVIDLDGPSGPELVGSADTPGDCLDVAVVGPYAYVADGYPGIVVIDISDPAMPRVVGMVDTPARANGVAVGPNGVYATDFRSFVVLRHQCGATTSVAQPGPAAIPRAALLQPYPNPFNPTVRIPIVLGVASRLNLTIFDVTGHEVIRLANERREPGRWEFSWDGFDSRGLRVASGSYIVQLQATQSDSRKVLLVR